ncbi:hypothetical protein MMYC01_210306 [Madurella mycetomatis]|uniref:Uncharacterized protein n=1 Tax=Madurella mycetomatis TaxID=100816 RepID=A0A175VNF9_9PEZI|nr:hypothetical protein MMYC01_210306 [Madurella mycetomatis]
MSFLNFDMGRLCVPAETPLFGLLGQCFDRFTAIFNLEDPCNILAESSTLERILSSISTPRLSPGMALIFQRLGSAGRELSASLLSRELQLFSESEKRRAVLEKIVGTHLLSSCYTKNAIVEFVVEAVEGSELGHYDTLPLSKAGEDLLSDGVAWVIDRPCKNMGLPWGFTIMAIN